MKYNVYCDESCHLEHDHQTIMVLGAIWCPRHLAKRTFIELRKIKESHGFGNSEVKWNKISPRNQSMYEDLINYFFATESLSFRCIVIKDKQRLDHDRFDQDHDTWYYKMYFLLLHGVLIPGNAYRVFLDIKDTRGGVKVRKLQEVLCNSHYDFEQKMISNIQIVRSQEVELVQLADILLGAASYKNRHLSTSKAKMELVRLVETKSGYSLVNSTLMREPKFNVFCWNPQ